MSSIPPNWISSVAGAAGGRQNAEKTRKRDEAAGAQESRFTEKLHDMIEAAEEDREAYEDAEGQGGQGKPATPADADAVDEAVDEADNDDPEAQSGGLDIEA